MWSLRSSAPSTTPRTACTQEHRLLARYLFAHITVHHIRAGTEVNYIAEQKVLEKPGSTRKGMMRGSRWRDGAGVTW